MDLEIFVADVSLLLKYKGYIEYSEATPFSDVELFVLVLFVQNIFVQNNDFNRTCPVIIGTIVLRICRDQLS